MNDIAPTVRRELMQKVIAARGDFNKVSEAERGEYLLALCESHGLNPLSQPLQFIPLNGKLVLYALKDCTEQLRSIHGVSVEEMAESERDGVFIVTAKVRNREGRADMAKGAVPVSNLKGEMLANAIMKAETKAKRRATLSLCGLGILDESEVDSIPGATPAPEARTEPFKVPEPRMPQPVVKPIQPPPQAVFYNPETGEVDGPHPIPVPMTPSGKPDWIRWGGDLVTQMQRTDSLAEGEEWIAQNAAPLAECAAQFPKVYTRIEANIRQMRDRLSAPDFMDPDDPLRPL